MPTWRRYELALILRKLSQLHTARAIICRAPIFWVPPVPRCQQVRCAGLWQVQRLLSVGWQWRIRRRSRQEDEPRHIVVELSHGRHCVFKQVSCVARIHATDVVTDMDSQDGVHRVYCMAVALSSVLTIAWTLSTVTETERVACESN